MAQCRQGQRLCGGTLQSFRLCLNNIDDLETMGLGCDCFILTFVFGKMEDDKWHQILSRGYIYSASMTEEETDYLKCIQAQGVPGDWHG
jgi:hypothetical protein